MDNDLINQLSELSLAAVITVFIWIYYVDRKVPSSDKYSTFPPRFWTGSVDSLVLWPVGFISALILNYDVSKTTIILIMAIQHLGWLAYTVIMHARYGQTVGKMLTKVRVVDYRSEQGITFSQALLREGIPVILGMGAFLYTAYTIINPDNMLNRDSMSGNHMLLLLVILPGLWFIAEVLTMLTNNKRRALHDFIAGTVVIRTNIDDQDSS